MTKQATQTLPQAKVGDLIQSYDLTMPVAVDAGSYVGTVTRVETDAADGVEYVYFTALYRLGRIDAESQKAMDRGRLHLRCPQNNTPTLLGRVTDGIVIRTPADRNELATASTWKPQA